VRLGLLLLLTGSGRKKPKARQPGPFILGSTGWQRCGGRCQWQPGSHAQRE